MTLFVPADFDPRDLFECIRERCPGAQISSEARGTLHLEVRGLPVSVLSYPYALLEPPKWNEKLQVEVASDEDLLCMKLSAIAGRGAAKEFWDLDALLGAGVAEGHLARALRLFEVKYPGTDLGHVVKALAYFGDADASPLPMGLTLPHWEQIKASFVERVRGL